ncbi:MAG TPA: phosphatase PAP2 family protein [Polyangiaceae bacterium]|nr:phosphatase PAP2 family protein [Polyangiaceae bacterium]
MRWLSAVRTRPPRAGRRAPPSPPERRSRRARLQGWARSPWLGVVAVASGLARGAEAHAQAADGARYELRRTAPATLAVEAGGAVGLLVPSLLLPVPESCRWCSENRFDRAARRALRAERPMAVGRASHLVSFGLIPAGTLGTLLIPPLAEGNGRQAAEDAVLLADTALIVTALTNSAKRLAARERPAFHSGQVAEMEYGDSPRQANQSFFSGDTSLAFGVAAAGTTLAALRGDATAPYLGVAGAALASGVGVARLAGDAHYATDVLAGALVGTALGVAWPLLVHPRAPALTADAATAQPLGAPLFRVGGVF